MEYDDARFFLTSYLLMCTASNLKETPKRTIHFYKEAHIVLQLIHDYIGTMPTNLAFPEEQEFLRGVHEIIRELRQFKQSLLNDALQESR